MAEEKVLMLTSLLTGKTVPSVSPDSKLSSQQDKHLQRTQGGAALFTAASRHNLRLREITRQSTRGRCCAEVLQSCDAKPELTKGISSGESANEDKTAGSHYDTNATSILYIVKSDKPFHSTAVNSKVKNEATKTECKTARNSCTKGVANGATTSGKHVNDGKETCTITEECLHAQDPRSGNLLCVDTPTGQILVELEIKGHHQHSNWQAESFEIIAANSRTTQNVVKGRDTERNVCIYQRPETGKIDSYENRKLRQDACYSRVTPSVHNDDDVLDLSISGRVCPAKMKESEELRGVVTRRMTAVACANNHQSVSNERNSQEKLLPKDTSFEKNIKKTLACDSKVEMPCCLEKSWSRVHSCVVAKECVGETARTVSKNAANVKQENRKIVAARTPGTSSGPNTNQTDLNLKEECVTTRNQDLQCVDELSSNTPPLPEGFTLRHSVARQDCSKNQYDKKITLLQSLLTGRIYHSDVSVNSGREPMSNSSSETAVNHSEAIYVRQNRPGDITILTAVTFGNAVCGDLSSSSPMEKVTTDVDKAYNSKASTMAGCQKLSPVPTACNRSAGDPHGQGRRKRKMKTPQRLVPVGPDSDQEVEPGSATPAEDASLYKRCYGLESDFADEDVIHVVGKSSRKYNRSCKTSSLSRSAVAKIPHITRTSLPSSHLVNSTTGQDSFTQEMAPRSSELELEGLLKSTEKKTRLTKESAASSTGPSTTGSVCENHKSLDGAPYLIERLQGGPSHANVYIMGETILVEKKTIKHEMDAVPAAETGRESQTQEGISVNDQGDLCRLTKANTIQKEKWFKSLLTGKLVENSALCPYRAKGIEGLNSGAYPNLRSFKEDQNYSKDENPDFRLEVAEGKQKSGLRSLEDVISKCKERLVGLENGMFSAEIMATGHGLSTRSPAVANQSPRGMVNTCAEQHQTHAENGLGLEEVRVRPQRPIEQLQRKFKRSHSRKVTETCGTPTRSSILKISNFDHSIKSEEQLDTIEGQTVRELYRGSSETGRKDSKTTVNPATPTPGVIYSSLLTNKMYRYISWTSPDGKTRSDH